MLNEGRVKHMVKLAVYESKGEQEIKISTYEKKDYVRVQVFITSIWVTVAYFMLVGLLSIAYVPGLLENMTTGTLLLIGGGVAVVYVVLLIQYIVFARRYYLKKYLVAKRNVKRFARNLEILEKMYEKEDV